MKRGRKSLRNSIKPKILEILSTSNVPLTISSIKKSILLKFNSKYSWNTIRKYLDELVNSGEVSFTEVTTSTKKSLRVYILKKQ